MFEFRPPAVVEADADLTIALRSGDEGAVRALYGRYGGLVYAIARQGTGDGSGVDPVLITLHTFVQAWRNSEAFEAGRSFGPWLATLTRSVSTAAGCPISEVAVDGLLADPTGWVDPPDGLEDRVVAGVVAEAHVDPAEIYTAADLEAARSGSSYHNATLRAVVAGIVGGLILVLGGIFVLSALGGSSGSESTTIELRPTGRIPDAEGTIEVAPSSSGLSIGLDASPLPDVGGGGTYRAVVTLDNGTVVSAGSFGGGADAIELGLSAAVPEGTGGQFMIVIARRDAALDAVDASDVVVRAPLP